MRLRDNSQQFYLFEWFQLFDNKYVYKSTHNINWIKRKMSPVYMLSLIIHSLCDDSHWDICIFKRCFKCNHIRVSYFARDFFLATRRGYRELLRGQRKQNDKKSSNHSKILAVWDFHFFPLYTKMAATHIGNNNSKYQKL